MQSWNPMKNVFAYLLAFGFGALLAASTGCTPSDSAGSDSAALQSVGSITNESPEYQPPRSPGFDDNRGSR